MPLIFLLACGGSEPAAPAALPPARQEVPPPAPPAPPLVVVREIDGTPRAAWLEQGRLRPLVDLPGAVFPADPDPLGRGWLVIQSEEVPGGQRQTLWWLPREGPPRALAPPAGVVRAPAWAPDGSFVVFESSAASFRDLYRVGLDGAAPVRLTEAPQGSFEPAVHPDGQVAYASSRDGDPEIYLQEGLGPARALTDHPGEDVGPRWAPDGSLLCWRSDRGGAPAVWCARPDGQDARPLRPTPERQLDLDFVWSPTGRQVAVVVQTGPTEVHLELVGFDGVTLRLDRPGVDEHPAWSPDGGWLAFTTAHGAAAGVGLATASGAFRGLISPSGDPVWLPRWPASPR